MRMPRTGRACYVRDTIARIALQMDSDSPEAVKYCLMPASEMQRRLTVALYARQDCAIKFVTKPLPPDGIPSDTLTRS